MGRPGPKKKARMSQTRSDFLTRCNSEGATQSDDDDEYYIPAHSHTLPPSLSSSCVHPEADCHSDSEMVKYRISRGPMTSKQPLAASPSTLFSGGSGQAAGDEPFNTANHTLVVLFTSLRLSDYSLFHSTRPPLSEVTVLARRSAGCWFQPELSHLSCHFANSLLFASQAYFSLSRDTSTF